ncbi:hypothetical protein HYALB_00009010 [Hymenoscyphus albidus]|uniref:FAD-binding PCMH-type domain-containing protein n=1 Tax=Hymenoscyphus albidus TaxID=595503 RepID=A0A9N9QDW7_9HELO|nr:hypothetical protein HYALB_00009010 [Hymenoscyphus albidus]
MIGLFVFLLGCHWAWAIPSGYTKCKNIASDPRWPGPEDWARLNATVDGRLIATVPIAVDCHNPSYNHEQCQVLKDTWSFADSHVHAPAEFLAPYFQNQSCDPFTNQDRPCVLGNYAEYSINVSSIHHIQAGVQFARAKNIRLTIKNTGHDLLGKSTGRGALSLWTHHLNAIDFIEHYSGDDKYDGPAMRLGAGVLTSDAFEAAHEKGLRVVTGTCPNVGVTGGYTSGGGHGVFTSIYGLAADNVLEWEVVTADGDHIVATPKTHADLYWALSGGGAGTFAVVVSMVTRVYSDGPIGGASFMFDVETAGSIEAYWNAVTVFQSALGPAADAGAVVSYALTPTALSVYGIAVVDGSPSGIQGVLEQLTAAMASVKIPLNVTETAHPSFLDFFNHYFLQAVTLTPQAQITGGRLVPRSVMENISGAKTVTQAFRSASDAGFSIVCNALNANQSRLHQNAVLPAWRSALLHCIVVRTWDFSIPRTEMIAYQTTLTKVIMPQIEHATPSSGVYLNEANFEQPNWQTVFYGANYPRLKDIKNKWDPLGVFYAQTAVGSEVWAEDRNGRLCMI